MVASCRYCPISSLGHTHPLASEMDTTNQQEQGRTKQLCRSGNPLGLMARKRRVTEGVLKQASLLKIHCAIFVYISMKCHSAIWEPNLGLHIWDGMKRCCQLPPSNFRTSITLVTPFLINLSWSREQPFLWGDWSRASVAPFSFQRASGIMEKKPWGPTVIFLSRNSWY